MIDEFILDKEQKKIVENLPQLFLENVYTPQLDLNSIISIYFLYTYVGKNTFTHEDGNNNFVHRNKPLGLEIGNDTRNIKVGFVVFEENKLLTKLSSGFMKKGHNNFIENPYKPYSDFNFGTSQDENIERITYLNLKIQLWARENISLMAIYNFSDSNILGRVSELSIGIDFFIILPETYDENPIPQAQPAENYNTLFPESVLRGWLTTGGVVNEFEEVLSKMLEADYVVAVNSCTAALHLALAANGFGKMIDLLHQH